MDTDMPVPGETLSEIRRRQAKTLRDALELPWWYFAGCALGLGGVHVGGERACWYLAVLALSFAAQEGVETTDFPYPRSSGVVVFAILLIATGPGVHRWIARRAADRLARRI